MASNLVSMANKLRLMVEQTKIQSEVLSNSAITQARIQAESEKQEVNFSFEEPYHSIIPSHFLKKYIPLSTQYSLF